MASLLRAARPGSKAVKAATGAPIAATQRGPRVSVSASGRSFNIHGTALKGSQPLRVCHHHLAHSPHLLPQQSLANIFGIGHTTAVRICADFGYHPQTKLEQLNSEDYQVLKGFIEKKFPPKEVGERVEVDNIMRKIKMGSWQGMRHQLCLPVRGQSARSNGAHARTVAERKATRFQIPTLDRTPGWKGLHRDFTLVSSVSLQKQKLGK